MNNTEIIYIINSEKNAFSPVLTKAKEKDEYCITASTDPNKIRFDNFFIFTTTFEKLKKMTPKNVGILLITDNGGRYFSPTAASKNTNKTKP
jgi:hypothetical protein